MLWRHLCLARAWAALGLLTWTTLAAAPARAGEPAEPAPAADEQATPAVNILEAQEAGDLEVSVRGQGAERVRFSVRNVSPRRLNVVLPPGLVAASVTGQLQSMGLGSVSNSTSGFGSFRSVAPEGGLKSVAAAPAIKGDMVTVPAGEKVEFSVASVCLNFGLPTPTPRDRFQLVDVDDYSADPRVRKALRSLATYGTSHGVAQAAMWRVCNNVPFGMMVAQFGKVVNTHETALAARFIEALDASGPGELVDPAYLTEERIYVQVAGEGTLAKEAQRLSAEIEGLRVLGLPIRVSSSDTAPAANGPAIWVHITLTESKAGETQGRAAVRYMAATGNWSNLGKVVFSEGSNAWVIDGASLVRALDRAMASTFITVKPIKHSSGSTTLKVENRLPLSLSSIVVKAGTSSGSPSVTLPALGIGPARNGLAPIEAQTATIERAVLNGL